VSDEQRGAPVIVLGMHRSGTSLLTRIVNLCGVRIDPESAMMPASWENPRGYWEPEYLAELNDAMLDLAGSAWYAPRAFQLRELTLAPSFRTRMQARIDERNTEPSSFVWKDPRLSITWPLWRPLLADPVVLICMRNPAAVSASLSARNGFPREHSYALWELYVEFALAYASHERHTIVHYEQIMADPGLQIGRLLDWLDAMGVVRDGPVLTQDACDECVPVLDRQHREPDELELDPLAQNEQKALYARLWQVGIGEQPEVVFDEERLRAHEEELARVRPTLEDRWWHKRAEQWQLEVLDELRSIAKSASALERGAEEVASSLRSRLYGRRRGTPLA
jgi:hypothetical protein